MSVHRVEHKGRMRFRIAHYQQDGRRATIRLGADVTQKRIADQIDTKVQALATAKLTGTQVEPEVLRWTNSISDALRTKLVEHGLIREVERVTLIELCNRFIERHRGNKPATRMKYEQVKTSLISYPGFGPDVQIKSITRHKVAEWRHWLATKSNRRDSQRSELDDNTVRRRTGIAKQMFTFAVESEWIDSNPFKGFACSVQANVHRQYFVSREEVNAALAAAPNAQWRAIIALSRFAGLRVPSELWRLTWADVDFQNNQLIIRASKTEHHASRGLRRCPIFPELRPFIEDLAELDKPGIETSLDAPIVRLPGGSKARSEANLRTAFLRILRKAGVPAWPKLFHNMRATHQTELLNHPFPIKDVCDWLGNSQAVAMKHYAMATQAQVAKAVDQPTGIMPEWVAQQVAQSPAIMEHPDVSDRPEDNRDDVRKTNNNTICIHQIVADNLATLGLMGEEGLEPPTSTL